MRQTIPAILAARNDVVHHEDGMFQVINVHLRPCPIAPKIVLVVDTWPATRRRRQIELDADGDIVLAVM